MSLRAFHSGIGSTGHDLLNRWALLHHVALAVDGGPPRVFAFESIILYIWDLKWRFGLFWIL